MGIRVRYFFFDEDGTITRIPATQFDRAWKGEPALLDYAGQRIRYAIVSVELENRKPVEVKSIGCHILLIDDEGRVDQAWLQHISGRASARLEQTILGTVSTAGADRKVVPLPLDDRWTPGPRELRLIHDMVGVELP